MLNLFYVYSGIVARMVPHIIERLGLLAENVLIVTDRSQSAASLPEGLKTVKANFRPFQNQWKTLTSDIQVVRHNARRIDEITDGRPYTAYLPSPSDIPGQQILWHPRCKTYWLVEEGLGSYCSPGVSPVFEKPFTFRQKINLRLRLSGLGRIKPVFTDYPHWTSKYAGAFGSNAATFPNFPPTIINIHHQLYQAIDSPYTRLVIFDDFSVFLPELQQIYLEVICRLVKAEHQPGDHWAYKLHPRCAAWPELIAAAKKAFDLALPAGTPCQALAPDVCAEDIGCSPTVTTYGYMSSCLFYIYQSGGRVVSFKHLIEAQDPAFPAFWKRFYPPVLDTLVGNYHMLEDANQKCNL